MKKQSQEKLPAICLLFGRKERSVIFHYYLLIKHCRSIANDTALSEEEKIYLLEDTEKSLYNNKETSPFHLLHKDFINENLDFSLISDLLIAARQDCQNEEYKTWAQLLDYCKYSAAPISRFLLALYNENPSTYLPAATLCTVLQITYFIQNLHYDVVKLKRIYIPEELLKKYKVSQKNLSEAPCSKNLHFLINGVLDKSRALLKDALILPAIVRNRRLKIYICMLLKLTDILINKLYNADIAAGRITLSYVDWSKAFLSGIYRALTTKRKTLVDRNL